MYEQNSLSEVCARLGTDSKKGLSEEEAAKRLEETGNNELAEPRKKSLPAAFLEQLSDPLIYVLLVAAAVSLLLKEISDAIIILIVVMLNALVGLLQEGKAEKALEALKKLSSPKAYVIRAGKEREIPADQLVPGDLVCLETGSQVPADLRLVQTVNLKIEESALTGEALPIEKDADFKAKKKLPLGDRKNMAYMTTMVTYGRGRGIVASTAMDTEIGRIASMINEAGTERTPLQKRLGDLGKILSWASVLLCGALFLIAVLQKRDMLEMLITAISLAVAAVPEGLPAVVTICLALSVTKLVKVHTIVRRLPSVETLGAVNIVCSDKTGTLTQNKMTVVKCYVNQRLADADALQGSQHQDFLKGMVLCNDGVLAHGSRLGDPTELALLDYGEKMGVHREILEKGAPRIDEISFDSGRKMMSTFHKTPGGTVTYTKGAPDRILERCGEIYANGQTLPLREEHRRKILEALEKMSSQALRTLAVAMRKGGNAPLEQGLVFLGIVGMEDPVRPEAAEAVEKFSKAGVKTVMITGDYADTALAIARQLGIADKRQQCISGHELQRMSDEQLAGKIGDIRVFARVSPEHKVRIVQALKKNGNIAAMTGDGVNDAPSLKAADIGIAMGMAGTDVAKQASDMVLTDDNFATIEKAIEEGRGVYENIKKSVLFLLSSNFGEIMTMFAAVVCGLASPLKSSHILWINLITDSLPALALGIDINNKEHLMQKPPRQASESLFAQGGLTCTIFYGILIAGISLAAFLKIPCSILLERELPITLHNLTAVLQTAQVLSRAQTYAFTVLGMSQLFHAIGMRDVGISVFRMNHFNNKLMILAFVLGGLLQFAVTEIPALTAAFGTTALSGGEWVHLGLLAAFPLLAHEILILLSLDFGKKAKGCWTKELQN